MYHGYTALSTLERQCQSAKEKNETDGSGRRKGKRSQEAESRSEVKRIASSSAIRTGISNAWRRVCNGKIPLMLSLPHLHFPTEQGTPDEPCDSSGMYTRINGSGRAGYAQPIWSFPWCHCAFAPLCLRFNPSAFSGGNRDNSRARGFPGRKRRISSGRRHAPRRGPDR